MAGLGMGELVLVLFILAERGLWLWMLVDCLKRESEEKLVWVIVLLLLPFVGSVLYLSIRYLPRRRGTLGKERDDDQPGAAPPPGPVGIDELFAPSESDG